MKSLLLPSVFRTVVLGAAHRGRAHRRASGPTSASSAAALHAAGPATLTWRTAGPQAVEGDGPGALGLLHSGVRALQGALPGARRAHRGRPLGADAALHARLRRTGYGWRSGCTACGLRSSPASSGTAGGVCRRVYAELRLARGASEVRRRAPHRHDETSQEGPRQYGGRRPRPRLPYLGWAHEGTGKTCSTCSTSSMREQRRAIEVTDGARIRQLACRCCPNARWVMDPSTWSSG